VGALNDRQREVLGTWQSSCKRLQNFIQDFLTYSVLETGEMQLRFEMGDLNESLAEVCSLWSPRFQEKGLALYFLANENNHALPIRRPQSAASNLESVGQCVQVHADGRTSGCTLTLTCGTGAPRSFEFSERSAAAVTVGAQRHQGQRGGYRPGHRTGISLGSV